jgi:hypothetical protein
MRARMRIPIQKVLALGLKKSLEIVSINAYISGVSFLRFTPRFV